MTQKNVAVMWGGLGILAMAAGVGQLIADGSVLLGTIFIPQALFSGAAAVAAWRAHQRGSDDRGPTA